MDTDKKDFDANCRELKRILPDDFEQQGNEGNKDKNFAIFVIFCEPVYLRTRRNTARLAPQPKRMENQIPFSWLKMGSIWIRFGFNWVRFGFELALIGFDLGSNWVRFM